ncbi:type II toxin-antitoxin system VapC family toxin [Rariglobus hedericola]|uniref:type II toxin-antitoxin system VapC family toxin n=1 Tax=Rariglobus hedericola TaxID=2597822 RepID=UPI001396A212|nr:type II toxin-antitoxin system VapC family toxin [Rariglobus hedericola]
MKTRIKYILDTHAFLWAATDEPMLGGKAARVISTTPYEHLGIADVTLQEIGLLLHSDRLSFRGKASTVLAVMLDYVTVLPITLEIAIAAPALSLPHGDQFDRIITATAKIHGVPLITKDGNITDSGVVTTIW